MIISSKSFVGSQYMSNLKITKKDIETGPEWLSNEAQNCYLDWNDVADYFWSLRQLRGSPLKGPEPRVWHQVAWSRNYNQIAQERKEKGFSYNWEVWLNLKFNNGAILRGGHQNWTGGTEIETIRALLSYSANNRQFLEHPSDPEFTDRVFNVNN